MEETPKGKKEMERGSEAEMTECKSLPSAMNLSSCLHFGQEMPLRSLISHSLLMEGKESYLLKDAPSLQCIGSENYLWGSDELHW